MVPAGDNVSKPIMKPGENVSKPIMKLKYNKYIYAHLSCITYVDSYTNIHAVIGAIYSGHLLLYPLPHVAGLAVTFQPILFRSYEGYYTSYITRYLT